MADRNKQSHKMTLKFSKIDILTLKNFEFQKNNKNHANLGKMAIENVQNFDNLMATNWYWLLRFVFLFFQISDMK